MRQGWLRGSVGIALVLLLAAAAAADEEETSSESDTSAVASSPKRNESTPEVDDRLVAVGALSGAHLYTTHAYISAVADAHRHGAYKADRVRELLTEMVRLAEANTQHLKKIRDGNLVDGDKRVIDDFLAAYALLTEEAESLIDYARTNSTEDLARYNDSRMAAWRKIKLILGIKQP